MGNRRKPAYERKAQWYNSMARKMSSYISTPVRGRSGEWKRGEGRHNVPYGPLGRGHHSRSVVTLAKRRGQAVSVITPEEDA